MFATYLRQTLTVEQIGYCERISESAAQYAQRLLSTKQSLQNREAQIAKELVYEYKDHGFVIDVDQAQQHLGKDWVLQNTPESALAEEVYKRFDMVNLLLSIFSDKRLLVIGSFERNVLVLQNQKS